jgi:hypothetical protein
LEVELSIHFLLSDFFSDLLLFLIPKIQSLKPIIISLRSSFRIRSADNLTRQIYLRLKRTLRDFSMLLRQFLPFLNLLLGEGVLSILEFFEISLVVGVSLTHEGRFLGDGWLKAVHSVHFIVH